MRCGARKLLVEGLAVEQPGQRIALAVVQQALVVLEHLEDAVDRIDLLRRKGPRLDHFQAGVHLVVHPDGQPQGVAPLAQLSHGLRGMGLQAFMQRGHVGHANTLRVGLGLRARAEPLAPAIHPGTRPTVVLTVQHKHFQ